MPVFMRKCKTCGKKFRTRNADEYTCPKHTVSFSVKVIEPTEKEKRMMDAVRMFAAIAASDTKAASAPAKKKPLPDCTIEIPMPLTGDGSLVSGLILDKMRANDAARAKRQKEKVAAKPAPTNSAKPEEALTAIANAKLAGRNATVVVKRGRGRPRKVYTGRITSVTVTSTPVTKPAQEEDTNLVPKGGIATGAPSYDNIHPSASLKRDEKHKRISTAEVVCPLPTCRKRFIRTGNKQICCCPAHMRAYKAYKKRIENNNRRAPDLKAVERVMALPPSQRFQYAQYWNQAEHNYARKIEMKRIGMRETFFSG